MSLKQKAVDGIAKVKANWRTPPAKRYMPFKEIAAYSGGGIGAYMIITMGSACLLATNSTLLSSTLGVDPMDMYIMYVLAVIANIPLTGIRANIIDNTRNKAGKYRPYIVTMAIPAAIVCNLLVWFPYAKLSDWLGDGMIFGETKAYVAKCAIIMFLNLLLHFFYYFFYDAYENLIHVLSPNSQERTDVASIKSVVYSFAPTIVNMFTPIIAQNIFHSNTTDIRVYRFLYPILTVGGLLLCMVVYKHTEEKIVQARTHVVQIKFIDALRAVAKNKYFWIISFAGWIGFLESAYANIMFWFYNYGGACTGNTYGIVILNIYGNASLWGMLLAPFCIRRWGKKAVLVVTNLFNILFILMLLPVTKEINGMTIWLILSCLYLNAFMGSFAHILNPSIQADIRDYQQYKTGERIDGMFAVVTTIGTVITLLTSSVLPFIYEKNGLTKENAAVVTSNPEVLNRVMPDGTTVGQILAEQLANGQDNYNNALSALYDPNVLISLTKVLILVAAFGALLNVIPYIWYDFNERKQKSVIRVLKVRAMFEDFGNGVLKDAELVEVIDIIRNAKEMAVALPKALDKKSYKSVKGKEERKLAKKAYLADKEYNDEIEIGKFVCEELEKFSAPAVQLQVRENEKVYKAGLDALLNADITLINQELAVAKAMPKATKEEKELRKTAIEIARSKKSSYKAVKKYFSDGQVFQQPDFAVLDKFFNAEDDCEAKLKELYAEIRTAKKAKDSAKIVLLKADVKATDADRKAARKFSKEEMDKHAYFNRAAKVFLDAEKLMKQKDNYSHFEEIEKMYDEAKARI